MRRMIAVATGLLLLVLGTQVALAQYTPAGSLNLSTYQPAAGGTLTASGTGYAPDSNINLTIESTPLLLTSATAGASGAFSAQVTIPASYSGQHTLLATGTDPQGSVRVLTATIEVGTATMPPTATLPGNAPVQGSDGLILAIAAAGIVLLTGVILLVLRRAPGR